MLKKIVCALAAPVLCAGPAAADNVGIAMAMKVDDNGVVTGNGPQIGTVPGVTVNSASDLPNYRPPATASQDFYGYAHADDPAWAGQGGQALSGQGGAPVTPGSDPNVGAMTLSLLDAENLALAHSWALRSAIEDRRTARGRKLQAVGAALPSFSYSVNYGAEQNWSDITGYAPAARGNFSQTPSLRQPLFRGGKIISGIRHANINACKVEEDIRYTRLSTRYNIRTLYYNCMLHLKRTDVYRKQTQISKEYWQKTQKRFEAGDVPELDVLRYQVQYRLREANYINARNDYNTSMTELLRYMGKPLNTHVVLTDAFDFTDFDPGNEAELTQYALQHRPDLKSAELYEKMARENVRQAKADLLPSLDGVANYTHGNSYMTNVERYGDKWNWSVGLQLNWNALAGMGQTLRGKIMEADAALCQAEFSIQDKADEVRQQVRNSVLNILSSIEWVKSQQENVEQANRVLNQENIRWNEGAGDYLQILDAQNSVAEAELSYWNGICSYKQAIVQLEYSLGKFYQTTGTEVQGMTVRNQRRAPVAENSDPFEGLAKPRHVAATAADAASAPIRSAVATVTHPQPRAAALEMPEMAEEPLVHSIAAPVPAAIAKATRAAATAPAAPRRPTATVAPVAPEPRRAPAPAAMPELPDGGNDTLPLFAPTPLPLSPAATAEEMPELNG